MPGPDRIPQTRSLRGVRDVKREAYLVKRRKRNIQVASFKVHGSGSSTTRN